MEFNEKLRLLRKNAGLTQRQVADAVGVTYRTYQNYEAGASMPAGDTASRLAAALGVSTDTLLSAAPASAPEAPDRALRALLAEMQALFAGGTLREEDKKYVLDALTAMMRMDETFFALHAYAMMKNNEDSTNAKYQAMSDRAGTLAGVVAASSAFMEPELLALSAPTLAGLVFMGERLRGMVNDWKNKKARKHV